MTKRHARILAEGLAIAAVALIIVFADSLGNLVIR